MRQTLATSFAGPFGLASLVLGAAFLMLGACSSDDGKAPSDGAAGESGKPVGGAEANAGGGAAAGGGGLAGSATDGGGEPSSGGAADSSGAGGAAGGAGPMMSGDCRVALSMNTSNAADAATPLDQKCEVITYDAQVNFTVTNGTLPDGRQLNVDFFEAPLAGASVKLEDGYDFEAHQGAAASYMDAGGVWNADKGTVSIVSVADGSFVLKLTNVHFVVLDGPDVEANNGEFIANGTIAGPAMPAK